MSKADIMLEAKTDVI